MRMPTGGGGPAAKASNQGLEVFSKTPHPEPPNSSGFRSGGMQGFQSMCHVGVSVFFSFVVQGSLAVWASSLVDRSGANAATGPAGYGAAVVCRCCLDVW